MPHPCPGPLGPRLGPPLGPRLGRFLGRLLGDESTYPVDIAIALVVQIAMTIPWVTERAPSLPTADAASYLFMTAGNVPLVWRRRAPFLVLFASTALHLAYQVYDGPGQPLAYPDLLLIYTIATQSGRWRRRALLVAILPVALLVVVGLKSGGGGQGADREILFSTFVLYCAYALGMLSRARREHTRSVEEFAAVLERERIDAERAAERERARIAREMHDVLSHAVSLMIVQAEAGPVAVRTKPERAEAAFEAIAESGRDAMAQLRRMLGLLKDADLPDRAPQPTLDELRILVDQVAATGLRVRLEETGDRPSVPADLQVTAVRIVQEALTNVVKHATATRAAVHLAWRAGELAVSVTDDGTGRGTGPKGGHGLIGLRERAAAHGGTVTAGPRADAHPGFEVRARLPL
ncbi:sensor histidine kinase [Streptomyces sp. NPDC002446]